MKDFITKRVLNEANHVIDTKDTIRKTAAIFKVSKSTVHNDLSERLKKIDKNIAESINEIFQDHDRNKHIRGGQITKEKYKKQR